MDLKSVCRTCLKDSGEMRDIYADETSTMINMMLSISDKLTASELDGLPGQICLECIDSLKHSIQFKQQCENAYETLKRCLGVCIETTKPLNSIMLDNENIEMESDRRLETDCHNETIACGPNEKCIQTEDICFYPCEMCELKFFNEETLKEHRTSHKNKDSGYKCRNCDKSYTRLSHLRRHINVAHPEVVMSGKLEDICCKLCEKHFTRHEHLRRHMLLHQEQSVKPKLKEENYDDSLKSATYSKVFHNQSDFNQHDDCDLTDAISAQKLAVAKIECNEDETVFEPEVNLETSTTDVPVKSEIVSDNETTPIEDEPAYLIETIADDHNVTTQSESEADDETFSPTKTNAKGRKAKKLRKPSIEIPNKSAKQSLKAKRSAIAADKVHQCNKCEKIFSRATHLKRHMATHSDIKPFQCDICDKSFRRVDHLNIHRHHHSSIKPHVCDVCQKGFTRSEHLRKHKECRHGDKTQVTVKTEFCAICQKGFTTPKYLQVHMKSHTDRTFACKFCEDKFGTKAELNEHQKTHVNERPFLCSECGLRFVRNDYLVIHMRRHKGEKPYKCKYCNKGFPRATDLTVHERYHTGEKTHLCTICGKGFQRAYNLLVHTRVHTGERPYQCPHCVKSFAQGNDLKAHVRRHTGERYKCDICSEGFIQGYHLTQHKRNVHGIDMKSHIRRVEKFIPAVENNEIQEMDLFRMQQSEQLRKLQHQTDDGPVDFRNHFKIVNSDGIIDVMDVDRSERDDIKVEQTHLSQDSRSSDMAIIRPIMPHSSEHLENHHDGIMSLSLFSTVHSKLKLPTSSFQQ